MLDREYDEAVRSASRVDSLSSNDIFALKKIAGTHVKPWWSDLDRLMARDTDDAVLLKAAVLGRGSLSSREKYRLDEATTRRGRRIPG